MVTYLLNLSGGNGSRKEGIFIKMNKNYATFSKFIGCLKDSCMHRKSKYYTQVKDENLKHNIDEKSKTA